MTPLSLRDDFDAAGICRRHPTERYAPVESRQTAPILDSEAEQVDICDVTVGHAGLIKSGVD